MGWSVCLLVFRWLFVTTPCVGLCHCLCSVGSLSRRHMLVRVFICVLLAHCYDAMGWCVCVCFCSDGSLSRRHRLVCVFVCVLMAHCHDAMCWSVSLFVFCWLIVTTPYVGPCVYLCSFGSLLRRHGLVCVCVCLCSDGSLSRRHGLVCVFVCVLMAHCHDQWIGLCVCVLLAHCHDAIGLICVFVCVLVAHCHDTMNWSLCLLVF